MLDKYKDEYKEFYAIISSAINDNKLSHAYMFEIDDNLDQDNFINDLCKALIFKNGQRDQNICNLIDNNNYPNIKIIKADGLWIKKEQILDIQSDFRKKSFDNKLKIYVIEDASKLNMSSANTLLKFLEEPEDNIIAILFTKNKYSVISTIVSRCLNICLMKKKFCDISSENLSYKIVEIIEKYREKALPYLYQLILEKDFDRKKLITILEDVQKIYLDLLHNNNEITDKCNYFKKGTLLDIKFDSDNELLLKKIKVISKNMDYLRYNVNMKTIFDKIIIDIYGGGINV